MSVKFCPLCHTDLSSAGTYATRVRAAFGLDAAQVTLGHSSANTSQIYAELDQAKQAQVAAVLG